MNWNKLFWYIIGVLLGSIICLNMLPISQCIIIFVCVCISNFFIEFLFFIINKYFK